MGSARGGGIEEKEEKCVDLCGGRLRQHGNCGIRSESQGGVDPTRLLACCFHLSLLFALFFCFVFRDVQHPSAAGCSLVISWPLLIMSNTFSYSEEDIDMFLLRQSSQLVHTAN